MMQHGPSGCGCSVEAWPSAPPPSHAPCCASVTLLTVKLHEVDGGPAQPRTRLIHSLMGGGRVRE